MIKSKTFRRTFFSAEVLREALDALKGLRPSTDGETELEYEFLQVRTSVEEWRYDTFGEFLADYRNARYAYLEVHVPGPRPNLKLTVQFFLTVDGSPPFTNISVGAPSRDLIESLFEVFERRSADCIVSNTVDEAGDSSARPTIFVGHGRSALWKDLKDHLQDQHHYPVVAYETGARAGHTVRDILQEMMASSSFALLVLTGDDKISDDTYRARQNVIHEAGLFQGKLGFSRAIILMEDDVEEFSNIAGIHQIRFSKGNIKETFGDVLATIRREFDAS